MTWLAEHSAAAIGEALRAVAPDLRVSSLTVPWRDAAEDPRYQSATRSPTGGSS